VVASSPASVRVRARMSNSKDGVAIALTLAGPAKRSGGPEIGAGARQHTTNGTPFGTLALSGHSTIPRKNPT
jgi:hypothetical protein